MRILKTLEDCSKRGIVIAHESGHNAGLPDAVESKRIMFGGPESEGAMKSRRVATNEECEQYRRWAVPAAAAAKH